MHKHIAHTRKRHIKDIHCWPKSYVTAGFWQKVQFQPNCTELWIVHLLRQITMVPLIRERR